MKKKGYIWRLAAVAMVLCLVTMSLTSGTLAKYASEASGKATATVAAWKIAFEDGNNNAYTETNKLELNLEDTQMVGDKLVADDKIAPGSKGSFALAVDGTGTEVAFTYTIELDMSSCADSPLVFYKGSIAPENKITLDGNKITMTGDVLADGTGTEAKETIWWEWDTTKTDTEDTAYGTASAASTTKYDIPVTIKAEQKLTA